MAASASMAGLVERFAASLGLGPAVRADATTGSLASHWDALRHAGIERPGLRFAAWLDLGTVGGVLPPLLANGADVDTVLRVLARFHPLWGDDEVVVDDSPTGGLVVGLRPGAAGDGPHADTVDAFVALLAGTMQRLTTPPVLARRLLLRGPAAPEHGRLARAVVDRTDHDALEFDRAAVTAAIPAADPAVAAMLAGYAQSEIDDRHASLVAEVRRLLRADLSGRPTLDAVSARLGRSPRALQEHLARHGATFAGLLDQERRRHALALLAGSAMTATAVGQSAGYRSAEGFTRAVRRWTGSTPSAWRAEHRPDH